MPRGRDQGRPRVHVDVRVAGDHGVVVKPGVFLRVLNEERRVTADRPGAERVLPGGLAVGQSDHRLAPLPVLIDEVEDGDRGAQDAGSEAGNAVERLFLFRVEDVIARQVKQARSFIGGNGSRNHPASIRGGATLGPVMLDGLPLTLRVLTAPPQGTGDEPSRMPSFIPCFLLFRCIHSLLGTAAPRRRARGTRGNLY